MQLLHQWTIRYSVLEEAHSLHLGMAERKAALNDLAMQWATNESGSREWLLARIVILRDT